MKKYVVIVAGGKGKRMGSEQSKQFLEVGNLPILMHTFRAFSFLGNTVEFILVLSADDIDHWEELCKIHDFNIPHQILPREQVLLITKLTVDADGLGFFQQAV